VIVLLAVPAHFFLLELHKSTMHSTGHMYGDT
jgi:hypothetical protein